MTPYTGTNRVTSPFGMRTLNGKTAMHNGIDLAAGKGTKIRACIPGIVESASYGYNGGRGNNVVIRQETSAGVVRMRHQHCTDVLVKTGQAVSAGTYVATEGVSGDVTGSHDHAEVTVNGKAVDPSKWLSIENKTGSYPQSDEVYNYSTGTVDHTPSEEENMKLKVCAPTNETPRSHLIAEGWIQIKDSEGNMKMYNPNGARIAREVASDQSNLSPVYEACAAELQPGEILVAVD